MEFKKIKSRVTSVRLLLAGAIGLLLYFAHVAFIPVALALLIFLVYQWVIGRRAYRAGRTGDLDEFEAGAKELTAG